MPNPRHGGFSLKTALVKKIYFFVVKEMEMERPAPKETDYADPAYLHYPSYLKPPSLVGGDSTGVGLHVEVPVSKSA